LSREITFFLPALAVVILDQITKFWVRLLIPLGSSLPEDTPIRLTHIHNKGAVFGLVTQRELLIGLTLFFILGLLFSYRRPALADVRGALGLILGGSLGNLIDRLLLGYVTDFIDLRVWPVFNLADASIVIGAGLFFLIMLRRKPSE